MKKAEIKVGGLYTVRVSGRYVTVRVDAIRETDLGGTYAPSSGTRYDVTNLATGRKTTFRSAAKFRRSIATESVECARRAKEAKEAEQRPDPCSTSGTTPPAGASGADVVCDNCGQAGHATEDCENDAITDAQMLDIVQPEQKMGGEQGSDPTRTFVRSAQDNCPMTSETAQNVEGTSKYTGAQTVITPTASAPNATGAQYAESPTTDRGAGVRSVPTTPIVGHSPNQDSVNQTNAPGCSGPLTPTFGGLAAVIAKAHQAGPATNLTQQQQDILATAKEVEAARGNGQRVLVIGAGAGTGKTFTLKQLEQVLHGNGQYTAFNSSLVAESKAKFKRAACNTTHSLAFRAVGHQFKHRLNGKRVRSWDIAERLGIRDFAVVLPASMQQPDTDGMRWLKASYLAGQVTTAIKRFCQSDDAELGAKHFARIDGIDEPGKHDNSNKVKDHLLPFAQRAWADLTSKDGSLPFSHDVYVKLWEQDRPTIAADYILLDEAQDTAPVMLSILRQQTHALLILVGDDNQQIYEWRGAVNAMSSFAGAPRKLLSQSFRFGQVVADVANVILGTLEQPTDLVMQGLGSIPTRVCPVTEPRCYLYRTNAGAIGRLMAGMDEGKRGHLIGGTSEVVSFCRAARDLQSGKSTNHPELGCFSKWNEVQEYSKEDEGSDLRLMVRLIDDFGAEHIIRALEDMPPEAKADFVTSTAHRSKGREWPSVQLGQDWKTADKLDDAERRLLYVACTRAQEELDLSKCPTFRGGYNKVAGTDEESWVPGIEVEYTVPMPTEEQLAAYRAGKSQTAPASPRTAPESPAANPTAQPAPDAATPAVSSGNGKPATLRDASGNTWSKGRNGRWLVRGPVGQSGRVTVTRRNGSISTETIKRVIWEDGTVALYEV